MNEESQQKAVFKNQKTQEALNTPPKDPQGMGSEDEKFLKTVISFIGKDEIDLHQPSTLLNKEIYDKLDEMRQGKADLEALNLLATLREIKDLQDSGNSESFQMKNLVSRMRLTKERIEKKAGDIFVI